MEIQFENIVLRDMVESDIENYVRWFTRDTAWFAFDAPWEPIETDEETERAGWREYFEAVKEMPEKAIRWKFEIEYAGRHIGWVSSYMIDENYDWIAFDSIREGQTAHRAIGIDICEPDAWNKGIGTNALRAFIRYYFRNGFDSIYTQTWSGNARMIRCAQKLGFMECNRCVDKREVDGKKYDALTFRLEKAKRFDWSILIAVTDIENVRSGYSDRAFSYKRPNKWQSVSFSARRAIKGASL